MATDYAITIMESRLQRALERVRVVLDVAKSPSFAGDVHHQYDDKYFLAECATNAAVASQLNCLATLGLGAEQLAQLRDWAKASAVSLRLRSEERCAFVREETREVEGPTRSVEEVSVGGAVRSALTSKVVTKVTEYFWKLEVSWELSAIRGVGSQPADNLTLLARASHNELKTTSQSPPRPSVKVPAAQYEVNVSWLFKHLPGDATTPSFKIKRDQADCHTPRRNPDVEAAQKYFVDFDVWAKSSISYALSLLQVQPDPSKQLDLTIVDTDPTVISVLPLLCEQGAAAGSTPVPSAGSSAPAPAASEAKTLALLPADGGTSLLLAPADTNQLLVEEARALAERRQSVQEAFPQGEGVASATEATLAVVLKHCAGVGKQWRLVVTYIEGLLRKQLIAAIGKEVSPADFAEYMRFHCRKLFADEYMPTPFCFAVRRSELHAPEGTVSIEQEVIGKGGDSNIATPIVTMVAQGAHPSPMHFPIGASTNVRFGGERYLHAWLSHQFSGESGSQISLVSKARQFSSMLVLVGRIASASTFEPKYAAIVQNKDELTIPLDMSTIPTPKEFKDAIESLSPEQQRFAKAFRAMQLESTLFGVLVIQIKPQLEKVLNLPVDSLTKEIKLTQDLMQLFIKYQIPSDLLSFDSGADADGAEVVAPTAVEKLETVKRHVQAMYEMIEKSKEEEVAERRMEANYARGSSSSSASDAGLALESCGMECDMMMECCAAAPVIECYAAAPMMAAAPVTFCAAPAPAPAAFAAAPAVDQAFGGAALPPSPPPPVAAQEGRQTQQQQPQPQQSQSGQGREAEAPEGGIVDYTKVPKELDKRFEELDTDSALRPTIVSPGDVWIKKAQKALLASPTTSILDSDGQKEEKDAAFDLLDALTKSGALLVDHAALHVVVAATHCFDKTVTETVVRDNVNPIDKVERSTLIMASTVHQKPTAALIRPAQYPRVSSTSPMLFVEDQVA